MSKGSKACDRFFNFFNRFDLGFKTLQAFQTQSREFEALQLQ